MEATKVDFGGWIEKGFNLYKENIGLLILATLVGGILSAVTLGVLAGPMAAGIILIVLRLHDKSQPKPAVGDVFKGFEHFLQAFLYCLVWAATLYVASRILAPITCLGPAVFMLLQFALGAFLLFGLFLIADRKMEFWPAIQTSANKVKPSFLPFLGFSVVSSVIGAIGGLACGIGVVVTAPIFFCIVAVAYRDVFGSRG